MGKRIILVLAAILAFAVFGTLFLLDGSSLRKAAENKHHQGCIGESQLCTRDSDCCLEPQILGHTMKCRYQCDEGGCLSYKQCLLY